jgi:hypothetical protein
MYIRRIPLQINRPWRTAFDYSKSRPHRLREYRYFTGRCWQVWQRDCIYAQSERPIKPVTYCRQEITAGNDGLYWHGREHINYDPQASAAVDLPTILACIAEWICIAWSGFSEHVQLWTHSRSSTVSATRSMIYHIISYHADIPGTASSVRAAFIIRCFVCSSVNYKEDILDTSLGSVTTAVNRAVLWHTKQAPPKRT